MSDVIPFPRERTDNAPASIIADLRKRLDDMAAKLDADADKHIRRFHAVTVAVASLSDRLAALEATKRA